MRTYSYRRELRRADWLKAIGIGAGAGLGVAAVTTYLTRLFLQRTPLRPPPDGRDGERSRQIERT